MKDFLYSFWITKLYGQNETLFYISKEIEIKIENNKPEIVPS